ncbi:hypothetical protein [Actinoplanes auranticolor]|uniref:WD40 repeat protein n=1 Tax=Actinoplanes auranticolor TaxID=47988 RepID=A0A919VV73_9ACTN|nr:hypothetical protein [Actinoplanes auranticolor]GIM77966.1 hypothetical protein Aau02nite_78560 [Actinoplanes auranticolor]
MTLPPLLKTLARQAETTASCITDTLTDPPLPDFADGDYGPLSTRWHAQSLSKGAAGVAILHGVHAQAGHGGWEPVHTWLRRATADALNNSTGAGLWFGTPAITHALTTAAPHAHPAALGPLDRAVADLAERRLADAEVRLAARRRPSLSEFDLVRGLTGLGAHLLTRQPEGVLLRRVLQYLVQLKDAVESPTHLTISPDERYVAVLNSDGESALWDRTSGAQIKSAVLAGTEPWPPVVVKLDDFPSFALGLPTSLKLWDPARNVWTDVPLPDVREAPSIMASSPDGHRLAILTYQGVEQRDPATGATNGRTLGNGATHRLLFSPRSDRLAVTFDTSVKLWDVHTGTSIGKPLYNIGTGRSGTADRHNRPALSAVAVSPDLPVVAAAVDDTVELWDVTTGKQVGLPLVNPTGPVRAISFHPDGKFLAMIGDDHAVRVVALEPLRDPIQTVCDHFLPPDPGRLVTVPGQAARDVCS